VRTEFLFNRQRTEELTSRRRQLDLEIEQAARRRRKWKSAPPRTAKRSRRSRAMWRAIEAILAALAAASAEISGAPRIHGSAHRRAPALRRGARRRLARLHGEQAQAEQALAHHVEGVARYERQEQETAGRGIAPPRARASLRLALANPCLSARAAWNRS